MKLKRIIQIIFMLAIVVTFGLLVNKEAWAEDRLEGSVNYSNVLSSYNNNVSIAQGNRIDVANAKGNSIFRNSNVFCIQKGTSLGSYHSYFTVGEKKIIDSKSSNVLKGLAYILSFQGTSNSSNYNLYNDNDIVQLALWRYIGACKRNEDGIDPSGTLQGFLNPVTIQGTTSAYNEAYQIFSIAKAIAKGALGNVGKIDISGIKIKDNKVEGLPKELSSSNINGENVEWEQIYINISYKDKNDEIKIKEEKYTSLSGEYVIQNNLGDIVTIEVIYKYFDVNAQMHLFTNSSGRQNLLIVKEANRFMKKEKNSISVPATSVGVSLQKYIYAINGEEVDSRKNMYARDRNAALARYKLRQRAGLELKIDNEYYGESDEYVSTRFLKGQSTKITKIESSSSIKKIDNPVTVYEGDEVTYRIEVYNNSDKDLTNVKIQDMIDQYKVETDNIIHNERTMGFYSIKSDSQINIKEYVLYEDDKIKLYMNSGALSVNQAYESISLYDKKNLTTASSAINYNDDNTDFSEGTINDLKNTYGYTNQQIEDIKKSFREKFNGELTPNYNVPITIVINNLPSNGTITFDITYRILKRNDKPINDVVENRVDLISAENNSQEITEFDENYRTFDEDYVKIEENNEFIIKKEWDVQDDSQKMPIMIYLTKDDSNLGDYSSFNDEMLATPIILNEENNWSCKLRMNYSTGKLKLIYTFKDGNTKEIDINEMISGDEYDEEKGEYKKINIYDAIKNKSVCLQEYIIKKERYTINGTTFIFKNLKENISDFYSKLNSLINSNYGNLQNVIQGISESINDSKDEDGNSYFENNGTTINVFYDKVSKNNTERSHKLGMLQRNNVIVNVVKTEKINLTVKKEFGTIPSGINKPVRVGFIIKKSVNGVFFGGLTDEDEVIYLHDNNGWEFTVELEKYDNQGRELYYKVEEVYMEFEDGTVYDNTDLNNDNNDIDKSQWTPSYSDAVKGQDGTITITNSYNQDVSLQKYIIKVNGNGIIGRDNKKATDKTTDEIYYKHNDRNIQKSNSNPFGLKSANPVEINKGAEVTYKITVYNNKESKATGVYVIDNLPTSIVNFKVNGYGYKQLNSKEIQIDIGEIEGKGSKDIEVTVEFPNSNISSNAERTNTATVYATNNQTTYRTTDSDYVVMTKVDLSLQKYIVGLDSTNIDGRVNRKADNNTKDPIYKNGTGDINSTGTNKIDDPVFIESGNTVKYNITIYNNGDKKATGIEVTDTLPSKATKYKINSGSWNNVSGGETITLVNNLNLNAGESTTITVEVELNNLENNVLYENKANLNNADQVITGNYRTEDSDYVKKAIYAVSLEKYVTKVESTSSSYSTNTAKDYGDGRKGQAEHKYDNDTNTNNYIKKDENYTQIADIQTGKGPVPVNSGDNVTYKIVLTNNGNVPVKITQINDAMDIGIKNNNANKTTENITDLANEEIKPGESKEVTRTYPITAPQLTLGILENSANITEVKNAYGKTVTDTTLNDNKDSDYIRLKGIIISGKVWEDTSDTKDNRVNGIYDNGETLKENITVKLQQSTNGSNFNDYKTTKTNGNGEYTFEDVAHSYKNSSGAYSYYIYQVVFEYDGVTYTHTTKGDINASNYQINSNASESDTTRTNFNNKFTEIKSDGAYDNSGRKSGDITYKTINEEGNAPMSVHEYNDSLMKITSSTDQIKLADYVNNLDYLKYINLGLRGRDVFDLRINTEVVSANVTVNGVTGTYGYNSRNGIEIRDNDLVMTDNTNKMSKEAQESITGENQSVRKTDLTALNAIQVTYKVTVKNESQTSGRATLITDYFDKALEFTGAEYNGAILTTGNVDTTNATYNKVTITIPDTMLGQSESIDIYLTFNVTDEGINAIKAITDSQAAVFYNMAEIESYQTNRNNVDIYTVGLIDRDSAPGSADEEKVRLGNPLDIGNITTVQYYFNKSELTRLKYEDDTSTAPTLVFRTSDNQRTLTGKVFEDDTKVENNVRSGDGKLGNKYSPSDEAENKIEGIKVELIDLSGNVIDTKTTDANGEYTFSGFLPGEYTIKYTYCGDKKTIYYNGQAYQSTNNTAFDKKTDQYWYVYNSEGYSIADENEETRKTVNGNWAKQDNEVTTIFKYVQDKGIGWNPYNDSEFLEIIKGYHAEYSDDDAKNYIKEFIEKNTMDAQTSTMKVELEQATLEGNNVKFSTAFGEYEIKNVNFGIALRPKTIIDTVLGIQKITIMDSANKSVLVSAELQKDGKYKITKGKVLVTDNSITIQVDDDKLHGATIEIVYNITVTNNSEKNYNGEEATTITINKVVVYLDNGLRFSTNSIEQLSNLNNTARVNYLSDLVLDEEFKELIESLESEDRASFVKLANDTQSNWKLDIENFANGSNSSATPLVSTEDNSLINQNLGPNESVSVTLPASKVTTNNGESTFNEAAEIGQITAESGVVTSNTILNNGIKASDSEEDPAGAVYSFTNQELDTGVAKLVTITPPTGENRNYTEVIIISIVSIAILAGGIIGIKKFMKK